MIESQIYKDKGKPFQILVPSGPPNHYRLASFATLEEAVRSAERNHPFNLRDAIADAKRAMHEEVLPELRKLESSSDDQASGIHVTQRTKNLSDLRRKIFVRVAETKSGPEGFDFSLIDDLAGARVTTESPAEVDRVVRRLVRQFGEDRVQVETKRGTYRATHLTIKTKAGPLIEVQVMTERVLRWSNWDHDRVYKTDLDRSSAYYQRLKAYGAAISDYFRILDGNGSSVRPEAAEFGIRPEDEFPINQLR